MLGWIGQALRTGIVTTGYPRRPEPQPAGVRNRLVLDPGRTELAEMERCAAVCPASALTVRDRTVRLDLGRCIQCGRCVEASESGALRFVPDYELAVRNRQDLVTEVTGL
ncbi:MAG: hypothetical protein LBJ87_11650 [bacterium]|jgi:formate hydrogenlyase subunit 6/NADH:ubiquinone oxidoreductase subunit I|nr:hypothetical protein [bacterium]